MELYLNKVLNDLVTPKDFYEGTKEQKSTEEKDITLEIKKSLEFKNGEKKPDRVEAPVGIINEIVVHRLGHIPIFKGDFRMLPEKVQKFVANIAEICSPRGIYICDGSKHEKDEIVNKLVERGVLEPLRAYHNNFLVRTDPADAEDLSNKVVTSTKDRHQVVCNVKPENFSIMSHWMDVELFKEQLQTHFTGCMAGRTLFVIPFSMGPIGGPLSKACVQITDSNYAVLCMQIMTRVSPKVWDIMSADNFVKCVHSVGLPRPVGRKVINQWLCNPERVLIGNLPENREIWSFGSNYGSNALLEKTEVGLRMASWIARDEGWLAEHMAIIGVTTPDAKEYFLAAAFPTNCGKTNFAMMQPTLPGYKVRVISDDIAWMKFGKDGRLYAINPETGIYGVCPGTNKYSNPIAMSTIKENTIFMNAGETSHGKFYWEGLEHKIQNKGYGVTDWMGRFWELRDFTPAAHPHSRFITPLKQCPTIHGKWDAPDGVPIDAIIFGGRRPEGVPLVFETFSWKHGVFTGACLKSEVMIPSSVEKLVVHDPMAMSAYLGYNLGQYLQHWLDMEKEGRKMPKIYHVNWFRVNQYGISLWTGYGENIRVVDWIIRRLNNESGIGKQTPIGIVPSKDSINLHRFNSIIWNDQSTAFEEVVSVPKDYWLHDAEEIQKFFNEQIGSDLPKDIQKEMKEQEKRIYDEQ